MYVLLKNKKFENSIPFKEDTFKQMEIEYHL